MSTEAADRHYQERVDKLVAEGNDREYSARVAWIEWQIEVAQMKGKAASYTTWDQVLGVGVQDSVQFYEVNPATLPGGLVVDVLGTVNSVGDNQGTTAWRASYDYHKRALDNFMSNYTIVDKPPCRRLRRRADFAAYIALPFWWLTWVLTFGRFGGGGLFDEAS